jgi:TPR repeat protein
LIPLADPHLTLAILAVALAVILRPRTAQGRETGPSGGHEPVADYLPSVLWALQSVGVAPVEALKGVWIDDEDQTVFDLDAILPPGLRRAYMRARSGVDWRRLDVGPLMAELTGPIRQGAERGEPSMILLLSHLHLFGLGVPEDHGEALRLARQAAEAGDLVAASILGEKLMDGVGTLPDFGEALVWLRRALPLGATKNRVGIWYVWQFRPDLITQAEAVEHLIIAFSRGDEVARKVMELGVAERNSTIDDWRLEARSGDPGKWLNLGMHLLFGPPGDRDEAEGVAALRQAARGRSEGAATLLEMLYREGERGLPKDLAEADKWASAAKRFGMGQNGGGSGQGANGSPGDLMTYEMRPNPAIQAGQRKKPRKTQRAKRTPPRGGRS